MGKGDAAMKQKLTKKFRAELIDALHLAAAKLPRHHQRGICSVLRQLEAKGEIAPDAGRYLRLWIFVALGDHFAYLNSWIRADSYDHIPFNGSGEHHTAAVRKLQHTRINWCLWMANELKKGK
jgi:hypothetical protein